MILIVYMYLLNFRNNQKQFRLTIFNIGEIDPLLRSKTFKNICQI